DSDLIARLYICALTCRYLAIIIKRDGIRAKAGDCKLAVAATGERRVPAADFKIAFQSEIDCNLARASAYRNLVLIKRANSGRRVVPSRHIAAHQYGKCRLSRLARPHDGRLIFVVLGYGCRACFRWLSAFARLDHSLLRFGIPYVLYAEAPSLKTRI